MSSGIQGWHQDTWFAPDGHVLRRSEPARNRVVHRGLDLIGDLLVRRPGCRGFLWFALGGGHSDWDAEPPEPSETASALHRELFRVPLDSTNFVVDPTARSITLQLNLAPSLVVETLREFGVFGGDANALINTGYLFSYRIHPRIDPAENVTLLRQLTLQFHVPALSDDAWMAVARLLTNQEGASGIGWWAEGTGDPSWDTTPPAPDARQTALHAEIFRAALGAPLQLFHVPQTHTVTASIVLKMEEAAVQLRETGLFTAENPPRLFAYRAYAAIDKRQPQRLAREFRIELAGTTTVTVPDLMGLGLTEAQAALSDAGLVADPVSWEEVPEQTGLVVGFAPAAGTRVPSGSRVSLVVGVDQTVVVPNVIGLLPTDANLVLSARNLVAGDAGNDIVPDGTTPGSVLRQSPPAGTSMPQGSRVMLTIGVPRLVTVPDLVGLTPAQAIVALRAVEILAAPAPYPTIEDDAETGTIVAQDPPPGRQVARASQVQLSLAVPRTLEIPDLRGLFVPMAKQTVQETADAAARDLGRGAPIPWLSIGEQAEEEFDAPLGTVFRQTPEPHARSPFFTAIRIVIARPPSVAVPDVIGLTQDAAILALQAARLTLGTVSNVPSALNSGSIISQKPLPGTMMPANSAVDVIIAAAIMVRVPDLAGHSIESGRELIRSVGLLMGDPIPGTGSEPEGTIIHQEPGAGTLLALGSLVVPTVVMRVPVPSVVGLIAPEAIAQLTSAGLAAATSLQLSNQPVGTVLAQNPSAGERVLPASVVSLTIAQGQVIPDLIGSPASQAGDTLARLGLAFDVSYELSDQPIDAVLSLSPPASTEVPLETVVHIVAASGVAVPDVMGLDRASAEKLISEAGLVASIPNDGDTVIAQNPPAGQTVPIGTIVTILFSPPRISVPNVMGKLIDEAMATLDASGLKGQVVGQVQSADPEGTVEDQNPGPGSLVDQGTLVNLQISVGLIL